MKIFKAFISAVFWSAFVFIDTVVALWLVRFIWCRVLCGVPVEFWRTWCVWVAGVFAALDFVCVFGGKICRED